MQSLFLSILSFLDLLIVPKIHEIRKLFLEARGIYYYLIFQKASNSFYENSSISKPVNEPYYSCWRASYNSLHHLSHRFIISTIYTLSFRGRVPGTVRNLSLVKKQLIISIQSSIHVGMYF